jgi:pimeloyl-ACP methyl ester carboxylesterase
MKAIILINILCSALLYAGHIENDTKIKKIITEDVCFVNEGDTLSGTIVVSNTTILCPAVIMIHGSGKATRDIPYAKKLAEKGLAVLTYDKRGCGNSGGEYVGNLNVSTGNLELLAHDALAGLQLLFNHPRIDKNLVGTWGISQAGWIAPIVATESKSIAFMVMLSCPTVTVVQELKYSDLAENDPDVFKKYSQKEIDDHMNSWSFSNIFFKIVGFNLDPVDYLKKLDIPVLWIYGEQDRSIPARKSIQIIQTLNNNKFEIKSYPDYGHSLKSPYSEDSPSGEVNEYFINWIINLVSK